MNASTKPLDIYGYLPTHGDGPYLGSDERYRTPAFGYLRDINLSTHMASVVYQTLPAAGARRIL